MTVPDPSDVDGALAEIVRVMRGLSDQYAWLHPCAFQTPRRGVEPGRSSSPTDLSSVLAATAAVRRDVTEAGAAVMHAAGDLTRAWTALMRAQADIEDHTPLSYDAPSERHLPRTATKAEVKVAKLAQVRRRERGEGWGSG